VSLFRSIFNPLQRLEQLAITELIGLQARPHKIRRKAFIPAAATATSFFFLRPSLLNHGPNFIDVGNFFTQFSRQIPHR
jgi:hypothetical protein